MKKLILLLALVATTAMSAQVMSSGELAYNYNKIFKNSPEVIKVEFNNDYVIIHERTQSSNNHWLTSKAFKYGYMSNVEGSVIGKAMYDSQVGEHRIWYWNGKRVYDFKIEWDEFN